MVFSGAAGGPFGLFDVVLPLSYDILGSLGHTFIRMRSQLSNGETGLAFLWWDTTRSAGWDWNDGGGWLTLRTASFMFGCFFREFRTSTMACRRKYDGLVCNFERGRDYLTSATWAL